MSQFLTVLGVRIPVSASTSADVDHQEVGGEVVRAYATNLLSSVKGHARVWRIGTPPVSDTDAAYYTSLLRSPYAVPCAGTYIGGRVMAVVRSLRRQPVAARGGPLWRLEFELHEEVVVAFDGNMLRNPGFEDLGAYWSGEIPGEREYVIDPGGAHSGDGYARRVVDSGQGSIFSTDSPTGGGVGQYYEVWAGATVEFGCWVYRESGSGTCRPRIWPYDANQDPLSPAQINGPSPSVDGEWWLSHHAYTVPTGVTWVRYDLQVLGGGTAARFDDAYLRVRP